MSNLKFTLFVQEPTTRLGISLLARVFDFQSLMAVHRGIQSGVFGHYSKKRYYLVPLVEVLKAESEMEYGKDDMRPFVTDLKRELQVYPKGGKEINPALLGLFPAQTY